MPELKTAFIANMRALLGEEAGAFFRALEEAPSLALRPHRGMEAAEPFIEGAVPWAEGGFYLRPGARPGASVAHWAGAFYLQEASAMLPAAALKARPGERVLDLCAAPGGKASQIALTMGGEGALVANEVDAARARVLAANLERLGVTNAVVLNETPARLAARWPGYFDAVLVDAPCSGEGMFRRDPQSREAWTDAAPRGCRKRQGEILDAAAKLVRPGGRLLYSTCTFNGEENEGSVADFLRAHADFFPEEFALPGLGASRGGMLRIWPHRARGDGQFAALLRRAGEDGGDGPETWAGAADAAGRPHARGDGEERMRDGADSSSGRPFARGDGPERALAGADAAAGEVFMRGDGADEDAGRAFARGDGEERTRDGADATAGEVFMRRDGADGSGDLSSAHPAASIGMWLDALPKTRPARRAGKAAPDVAALLRELGKCAVSGLAAKRPPALGGSPPDRRAAGGAGTGRPARHLPRPRPFARRNGPRGAGTRFGHGAVAGHGEARSGADGERSPCLHRRRSSAPRRGGGLDAGHARGPAPRLGQAGRGHAEKPRAQGPEGAAAPVRGAENDDVFTKCREDVVRVQ